MVAPGSQLTHSLSLKLTWKPEAGRVPVHLLRVLCVESSRHPSRWHNRFIVLWLRCVAADAVHPPRRRLGPAAAAAAVLPRRAKQSLPELGPPKLTRRPSAANLPLRIAAVKVLEHRIDAAVRDLALNPLYQVQSNKQKGKQTKEQTKANAVSHSNILSLVGWKHCCCCCCCCCLFVCLFLPGA